MMPYTYKVIGYADSDLSTVGTPFAVVVYMPSLSVVRGYVLSDLQEGLFSDRLMIEGFLEDLQHYSENAGTPASGFFDCLESLDMGPIRTLSSGKCAEGSIPLDTSRSQPVTKLATDDFAQLLGELEAGCSP